jgi:hypothetical protein
MMDAESEVEAVDGAGAAGLGFAAAPALTAFFTLGGSNFALAARLRPWLHCEAADLAAEPRALLLLLLLPLPPLAEGAAALGVPESLPERSPARAYMSMPALRVPDGAAANNKMGYRDESAARDESARPGPPPARARERKRRGSKHSSSSSKKAGRPRQRVDHVGQKYVLQRTFSPPSTPDLPRIGARSGLLSPLLRFI